MTSLSAYSQLETKIAEVKAIDHLAMLSNWDESTCMPRGGAEDRAEIIARVAALRRRLISSSEFGDLIESASVEELDAVQDANVRCARRERESSLAIPEDLLMASKRAFSASQQLWEKNRPDNDWPGTKDALKATLSIVIEMSQHYADAFDLDPYDALINQYETGLNQALIDPVFTDIKEFLVGNVATVEATQTDPIPIECQFDEESQLTLARAIMKLLHFDFERGRLDQSAHPFSSGTANDARITTRLGMSDFTESLFAVIHETGHSRYTQNQPQDGVLQFSGEPTGMAIHESQSLFLEMQIARSDAFLALIHPMILTHFGANQSDGAWSIENLKRTVRKVKRDFIRVYADEMTYPFHILLRYEMEKQLCSGQLDIEDIPDAWNWHMKELLDLDTRGNYQNGCMQDIHWYTGLFGYFPCYLIGAVYAAQLNKACLLKIGDQSHNIRNGDLTPISDWLANNVHCKGSLRTGPELMREVTNQELSANDYLQHLSNRYFDH